MECTSCEDWICGAPDATEGITPQAAAAHLAGCPACRAFQATWTQLDTALVGQADLARLPENFGAAVIAQLPAPKERLTPSQIAGRKAQIEREYREALRNVSVLGVLSDPTVLLRPIAMVATCISVGIVVAVLTPLVATAVESAFRWSSSGPVQAVSGILGLVVALLAAALNWRSLLRGLSRG